jgi:hypothetical protein
MSDCRPGILSRNLGKNRADGPIALCARAVSGHAAAALPISVMKSRLRILPAGVRPSTATGNLLHRWLEGCVAHPAKNFARDGSFGS